MSPGAYGALHCCQAKIEEEEGACEDAGQECAADSTDCNNYSVQISCVFTYMSLYRCYILCTAVSTLSFHRK